MNRLPQKCAIAATGIHLLLLLVLFVGPALMSPPPPAPDMAILNFVPLETVDDLVSGGGNPNARPPAAQMNVRPEAKAPVVEPPAPAPEPMPEPRKPEVKEPQPQPEPEKTPAPVPNPESKPKKREITLKPVIRRSEAGKSKPDAAAQQAQAREAREYAESRRRLTSALASAANGVSPSDSVDVKDQRGPGGGGVPYANFLQAVKSAYTRAWVLPEGVVDDNATVGVSVTIARDGSVVASRIIRPSNNGAVNQSVRATLDAVRYAAPLPRTAKEDQRTVTIDFNVRAKRLLG